ncbi:MAG: long-chain fatty acid--CoA ligase [Alphaproteobacteria bacterium]|nr:long-chain fatty acid--CoA ligase [Alphaproteobacteria bacterium]MBU0795589.1 long-chain fatty acid--CoA ligase [Alphaproteobacteria bacterium]MBU0887646.1 long-chain fatty acid--CoA ligase [Alphaproteobacteria bacterium]MBU1812927.1 long-chain fatty acid--CoA ligase [Alphaproteobacteria bacterium]MBU2091759.1 long-chain fatty acid--CoA ligase [Alphaproteobacteria bacterium]
MFFDQAESLGDKPFLWAKKDSVYSPTSWREADSAVRALARALKAQGIRAGDRVVIISENRPEWAIADLAIIACGAVTVPAYVTNTVADNLYILENCGARGVICSSAKLLANALPAATHAAQCEFVIGMEEPEERPTSGLAFLTWQQALLAGAALDDDVRAMAARRTRNDLACIIYTSGTGGAPKGVMLSHRALFTNLLSAHDLLMDIGLGDEVFLSFLPLSHSYEHTCGLFFPISIGAQIYYAEGADTLAANLLEARPTIMTAVPRLYEVLHGRILAGVQRAGGKKLQLFMKALELGRKRVERPGDLTLMEKAQNLVLDLLVRRKVKQRMGGRLKTFISGGAPLNYEVGMFFLSLGVKLCQGYGQTEAAPVIACNRPFNIKIATVGPPLLGVEVKIAEDGEILARGDFVMDGYWDDPEATERTVIGGWLHTGDVGVMDADGYITITDRKRDIIVISGGDNISPQRVEGFLTLQPEITQAMVYGDKRPYLVALIVPAPEFVERYARENGAAPDLALLASDKGFRSAIASVIDRVNGTLSQLEKIRRFLIATEAFTTDNHMMTPTLKIRRHSIRKDYGDRLDALYEGKGA